MRFKDKINQKLQRILTDMYLNLGYFVMVVVGMYLMWIFFCSLIGLSFGLGYKVFKLVGGIQ